VNETKLLTVQAIGASEAVLRVYADAVLYQNTSGGGGYTGHATQRFHQGSRIFAMSLVGPEQALRAIGAGCCNEDPNKRTELEFSAAGMQSVTGKWAGAWNHRTQALTAGCLHMVALPAVTFTQTGEEKPIEHVIIPTDRERETLHRMIYERLLLAYTTPLIPLYGVEAEAGWSWCQTLVPFLMADSKFWCRLRSHPAQIDQSWASAGLLTLREKDLDSIVSEMVKRGRLVIPNKAVAKAVAEAVAA